MALLRKMKGLENARNPRLALVASPLFAGACLAISAHAASNWTWKAQESF